MTYLLALSTLALILILAINYVRSRRSEKNFLLKPNCLLTRHPIVFLSGFKSLFYFGRYYNQLPDYINQHGYEVIELDLDWRSKNNRIKQLQAFIEMSEKGGMRYHFFADSSIKDELKFLESLDSPVVASTNTINENEKPAKGTWSFILNLHNLWLFPRTPIAKNFVSITNDPNVHEQVLNKAISLAEYDLR